MSEDEKRVGLCLSCLHARRVPSRTSAYWLCGLAARDPRYEKYPRLPVIRCAGFTPRDDSEESADRDD